MIQLRLLKVGGILLLVTAVTVILLIASGNFDPKPVGTLVWQEELQTMTIPAQTKQIEWLDQHVPDEPFSVRLTAVYEQGAADSCYGLILGDDTENLLIAVSPLGYATIQQNGNAIFPWQPWPHVRTANTPNEIWLDWENDQLSVRLNRELLWVGDVENPGGFLGLYGESFAETAVFEFESIELFRNDDSNNNRHQGTNYQLTDYKPGIGLCYTTRMNSQEIAARIQGILPEIRQEYGVRDLWLFGSYVRSSQTDTSDVDILVTFDNPHLSLVEFIQLEQKLTDLLGIKVDLVERDSLKPVIGQDILQEAVAL